MAGLFLACVFYLAAAGALRDRVVTVREDGAVEYRSPALGESGETFRIIFRLKTGELIFIRERRELENQY